MQTKRFEYHYKDVPSLKKDCSIRILFAVLFFAVFIWQSIMCFFQFSNENEITSLSIASTIFVMILSLLMGLISLLFAFRLINSLNNIRRKGKSVQPMTTIFGIDKTSYARLYYIVNFLIVIAMIAVLSCGITMFVLEIIYYSKVSYYLPILFVIALCGFNSVYHINEEIKTVKNVQEFNSIY